MKFAITLSDKSEQHSSQTQQAIKHFFLEYPLISTEDDYEDFPHTKQIINPGEKSKPSTNQLSPLRSIEGVTSAAMSRG